MSEGHWVKAITSEPIESHMFLAFELGVASFIVTTLMEPVCKLLIIFHSVVVLMAAHFCTALHADIIKRVQQKEQCCRNVNFCKSCFFNQQRKVHRTILLIALFVYDTIYYDFVSVMKASIITWLLKINDANISPRARNTYYCRGAG